MTSRIADLRTLLSKDVVSARAEMLKHVREIEMTPQRDGQAHYEARGEWSLLGDAGEKQPYWNRQARMVAGACNAPKALVLPFRYKLPVSRHLRSRRLA